MSIAAAVILWTGASFYAIFGGADFGGGFWDLIAGDAKKGWEPRMAIQRSLTPVWEANHVWLIFILVVLWTAFPTAFSAIFTTLYVPLILAVLGIVLRGSGFAFRKSIEGLNEQRAAGATFALSSVITPFFMGTVVGAIAAGNVPAAWRRPGLLELDRAAAALHRRDVRRHQRLPGGDLPGRRLAPRR